MPKESKAEEAERKIQQGLARHSVTPQRMIAVGILEDVMDRRKNEFAQCDPDVIQEILADWEEIARIVIRGERLHRLPTKK